MLSGLAISIGLKWPAAGVFVAVLVVAFAIFNVLVSTHFIRPANLASTALDSQLGANLADAIGGNPVVKGFGAEAREEKRFSDHVAIWRTAQNKTWDRFNTVGWGQNFFLVILQAGLTGQLVHAWSRGEATPGDVAFGITSFIVMAGYMRNFSEITRMLQKGLDDMVDVAAYMRTPPQLADRPDAAPFRGELGEVVFDRVTFGYENAARPLYRDFTLVVAPGERVALVGPTGRASRPSSSCCRGSTTCRAAAS